MKPLFIFPGMRRFTLSLSLVALALFSALFSLPSPAQAQVRPDVVESLMKQSGAWGQLSAVSPAVQSYLLAALDTDPSGESAKRQQVLPISLALQKAFAPDRLRQAALQVVARQLSPADAKELKAWYDSELGQQISAIEAQASDPAVDPRERLRQGAVQAAALSSERRILLSDVLVGTHAIDMQTEVLIQSLQAIHPGTSGFMPKAAKVSPKELKSRLEGQRKELQMGFQAAGMSLVSGAYAALSDAQLQAYRDFLNSAAGARLQALQKAAMAQALREAVDESSRQLQAQALSR
jgi:Uncharacterized protein conserved in bacteria (DUF2059)